MTRKKKTETAEASAVIRKPDLSTRPNTGGTYRWEQGETPADDQWVEVDPPTRPTTIKERQALAAQQSDK